MNQRIACLWFPNWPIQRRVVSRPELRKQRVILFKRDARRGQLVAAASPLAMRAGVSVAMSLSEAKSLLEGARRQQNPGNSQLESGQQKRVKLPLERVPQGTSKSRSDGMMKPQVSTWDKGVPQEISRGVTSGEMRKSADEFHMLPHQPDKDRCALEAMADSLESYSPIVGLESFDDLRSAKKHSPECIFMDMTGLAHLFGDEHQLAELTMQHCQQAGYLVRITIADTLGLAWATARFHRESINVLPSDDLDVRESVKAQLPISALRLPIEMIDTLSQLGIHTVSQLERLPRAELAMRFGHAIGLRVDQLNGVAEEPVVARRLPTEFQEHESLDFPTHHRETIEVITTRLLKTICKQLRAHQRGALQWRFTLDQVEGDPIEFTIRLFHATATPADVQPLLTIHLEQVLQPHTLRTRKKRVRHRGLGTLNSEHRNLDTENRKSESSVQLVRTMNIDVQGIMVAVVSSSRLIKHQRRLFDENPHTDQQAMSALINRLTSRIGASNVVCAKLQANAQPEYAFRLQPLVEARQRRAIRIKKGSHLFARPLRLFHPPRELKATSSKQVSKFITGTNISSPPALLCYDASGVEDVAGDQTSEKVIRVWGPERIETGWWRGRTTCRDYWRVETERGTHLWVFRDLRRRKWFVQGEF